MSGCCADKACNDKTCMTLPDGKMCADCKHIQRCTWLFQCEPDNTECDWFPRRFLPIVEERVP